MTKNASTRQAKRDYLWNMLGSLMTSLASVWLLLVVTRTLGATEGGSFALGFAVSQQFQILGAFEVRPYQSTDLKEVYSFSTYFFSRVFTCVLMFLGILVYAFLANGFTAAALLMILIGILRIFDAFEDVFHGAFQQFPRLDVGGKALFFRTLTTAATFTVVLVVSHDLFLTCAVTFLFSFIALMFCNVPQAKRMLSFSPRATLASIGSLLRTCAPLFIGSFLSTYILNAPKYGIQACLPMEFQTYYSVLFCLRW